MHRTIQYELLDMIFLRFSIDLFEETYSVRCLQRTFNFPDANSNRSWNIYKAAQYSDVQNYYTGIISILVQALSDFSTNFCKTCFFNKTLFLRHFEN